MPIQKLFKKPIAHQSKKRSFLTIASELRNFIYAYHYDTIQLIELMPKLAPYRVNEAHKVYLKGQFSQATPTDQPNDALKQGIRSEKLLGKYNRVQGIKTRWHLSISGLHLVNKQIYQECVIFLYASISLMTQSHNRLNNFLTIVPKKNLKLITRLQLDHQTYGHPRDLEMESWKKKHDEKWVNTCKLVVRKLAGLKEAIVNIDVRDIPLRFTLNEAWVKPMLLFSHRKTTLKDVRVNIFTPELGNSYVDVKDGTTWTGWAPYYVRILKDRHEGVREMHGLFGRAIVKRINGFCEDCSLEEYREAMEERFDGDAHMHASNTGVHNGD
jgi:hypothetical protein